MNALEKIVMDIMPGGTVITTYNSISYNAIYHNDEYTKYSKTYSLTLAWSYMVEMVSITSATASMFALEEESVGEATSLLLSYIIMKPLFGLIMRVYAGYWKE